MSTKIIRKPENYFQSATESGQINFLDVERFIPETNSTFVQRRRRKRRAFGYVLISTLSIFSCVVRSNKIHNKFVLTKFILKSYAMLWLPDQALIYFFLSLFPMEIMNTFQYTVHCCRGNLSSSPFRRSRVETKVYWNSEEQNLVGQFFANLNWTNLVCLYDFSFG